MGFKVRGYTRDVPLDKVRDYSLFAIATEGTVTEPGYFRPFDGINRVKVDIIQDENEVENGSGSSSPRKVLERVQDYIRKHQLSPENGDSLWCVIDVDRWPQEQIEELHTFCLQKENWHLSISNPCIEIWLLYHTRVDLSGLGIKTSKDAKRALDRVAKYYYMKYLPLMPEAIKNAQNADTNPDSYMPEPLITKVYQLGQALYDRIGKRRFEEFVSGLAKKEQEMLGNKR